MTSTKMIDHYDVAIVGYGPTGLILASVLGQAGHKVAVIERWPTLFNLPRLSHIDDETARIVQATADVADALANSAPINSYDFYNGEGELLLRVGSGSLGTSGYPIDISIFQPDIDSAIDRRIASLPNVARHLGFEATSFEQTPDGVDLNISPTRGQAGEARRIRARFVVGCDGARSTIRQGVAVEMVNLGFHERWLNIDTKRLRPLPEKFELTTQICDPKRGHMHLPIGTRHLRFELAVLTGEDEESFLTQEFAWKWLGETHGVGPEDVQIIRQTVYEFQAHIAKQWRFGRVFLAGDAAHTTPPYLGQGACSGMRDGLNLGWKLDLVLRGVADDSILDTYFEERCPHVTTLTKMAVALGNVANEHDPVKAKERDAKLRANSFPAPKMPHLVSGLLTQGASLAGKIFPQREIELRGRTALFDEVVGRTFVLVSRGPVEEHLNGDQKVGMSKLGVRLVALSEIGAGGQFYSDYFDQTGVDAVLVRPDFYIFGAAGSMAGVGDLVSDLLSRISGKTRANSASVGVFT